MTSTPEHGASAGDQHPQNQPTEPIAPVEVVDELAYLNRRPIESAS